MTKKKNIITAVVAVLVVGMLMGNAMAFSFTPPKMPHGGVILKENQKMEFEKNTSIGIQLPVERRYSFSMGKMFGKHSNDDSFVIALNNTTSVDFADETALELPDIVDGAEITFEHAVNGTIKFIPQKIAGKPQLIITIDRADNSSAGMNVTISLGLLNAYLGYDIDIAHTVNVTASMTKNTVTIYIEHFSTQTLTAEGLGTPADTSMMVSFIFVVIAVALLMVYAVIHYKQSNKMLNPEEMRTAKKATLWAGLIMLILAVVEFVYPFIYL